MARNQVVNGSLVPANRVPAVTEVRRWHPLHWNSGRKLTLITQCASSPHLGQSKPLGQRAAITACAQAASVPKPRRNSDKDMPCWHWIRFIAMAKLRRGMLPAYGAGSSAREPGLRSSLIRKTDDEEKRGECERVVALTDEADGQAAGEYRSKHRAYAV